jgi:CMP-N-acetylneuraminic acid synthetase
LTENEQRILDTRMSIKDSFIQKNNVDVPKAIAVIPVRPSFINKQNLALVNIGRYNLLERTVRTALQSKYVTDVIITTSDADVEEFFEKELTSISRRIKFVKRPAQYSRYNETLGKTILNVLHTQANNVPDAVINLAPEFPFLKYSSIDDAIQTLAIFQCDSLISVRSDTRTYYRHTGDGLKPILEQDRFTQFEREALYKAVGGITVCRTSSFLKYKNMQCGKVGHIMIDNEQAHGIFNEFDLQVAQLIASSKEVQEKIYS